eukprot:1436505-Amphidinium_carterae.1
MDLSSPFLFNVLLAFILQDLVMDWIGIGYGFLLREGVRCVLQCNGFEIESSELPRHCNTFVVSLVRIFASCPQTWNSGEHAFIGCAVLSETF